MWDKICQSLKDRTFWAKCYKKIHQFIPVYWVDNPDLVMLQENWSTYKKYKKRYKKVIESFDMDSHFNGEVSDIIWICWFQGEQQAPKLVQACIQSIRMSFPDKKVIVLDEQTIKQYVQFPDYILKKRKRGSITPAHYSDLVRIELLSRFGGLWVDSTVLCTGEIPGLFEQDLFVYQQLPFSSKQEQAIVASSWLIYAKAQHPIILLTRQLLLHYWQHHDTLDNYFLFHIFFSLSCARFKGLWEKVPFYNNHSPHMLQRELETSFDITRWAFHKDNSAFHKLNHHLHYDEHGATYYTHLLHDYIKEVPDEPK